MRGTWDDLNRRLTGAILALDLDDGLLIRERAPERTRRGLFGVLRPAPVVPRRYVQVTAAARVLVAECVGSTSFGGEWEMTPEQEEALLRRLGEALVGAVPHVLARGAADRCQRRRARHRAGAADAGLRDGGPGGRAGARGAGAVTDPTDLADLADRPRLVLVNGMPGAGKSTLAERYRAEHPGVLCVEADLLRAWIGGDPAEHAEAARVLALALCRAHLAQGYDVVVPQLLARVEELERFERVADECGAELVEVVLHGGVVDSRVPDSALEHLVEHAHGLADVVARRPRTHRLATRHGDIDSAYHALVDLLDPDLPA